MMQPNAGLHEPFADVFFVRWSNAKRCAGADTVQHELIVHHDCHAKKWQKFPVECFGSFIVTRCQDDMRHAIDIHVGSLFARFRRVFF